MEEIKNVTGTATEPEGEATPDSQEDQV